MVRRQSNLAALSVLKRNAWFQDLDHALLEDIAALSELAQYANGQTIFTHYDYGDFLYGVISGEVRLTVQAADGREFAFNSQGPGDIGGEIAVLDGGKRTATGKAVGATTLFLVPRRALQALMLREPSIAVHLIRLLCERVRHISQRLEDTAFLSIEQRLALQLRYLAETQQDVLHERGEYRVRISQNELAAFLNISRQAVNKVLRAWQSDGLVKLGRGHVTLPSLTQLMEI